VVTVHNGVDMPAEEFITSTALAIPYVLYVGGHQPRKNVAGVLRAMHRYWERFDEPLELRMTGTVAMLAQDALDVYRRLPHKAGVRFLGDLEDGELARQYAGARALLMLSHNEGFGLPALEAMAHGCPVVAASNASLPEVVGDAGVLVDGDDPEGICDAVRLLAKGSDRRSELIRRGRRRAREFGWDATASRMRELYERALGEKVNSRRSLPGNLIAHPS
jgi:glycosyltransferase involved in cell wall biosynthesis